MRRTWSLATLPAVALLAGSSPARAALVDIPTGHASVAAARTLTGLALVPGADGAELVIGVSGPVEVHDFAIASPHRIVLDLGEARLGAARLAYDGTARGGVTNVRVAQNRADVVRIVVDLDAAYPYAVTRDAGSVRVTIRGEARFAAWQAGAPVAAPRAVTEVASGTLEAPAEASPLPAPEAPAPAPAPQAQQPPRITVTWSDADIRDVIAGFAAFAGRTIVVGKDVGGTVTAEVKDQPWDVALKAILEAQGLAATEDPSGIITVDSYRNILEKQSSEPVTTQMVAVNYVSAATLVKTMEGLLYKECALGARSGAGGAGAAGQGGANSGCIVRGTVSADSATNSLIISEVSSRLPDLMQYLKSLDVRTPQVALKAKIISVSRTQIEQLGLAYDLGSTTTYFNNLVPRIPEGSNTPQQIESRIDLGGEALAGISNASRKYKSGSALNLIFSTALGKYSLTSFLDALHETQLSDIQAEPSIVTLDNRQARILVGQETPVRVIDAGAAAQIGTPARANVQFRETGIILTVTPHVTNNRQISMSMEAEQSELRIVGGDLGFIIDKRNARTQLLVNNGETAVIGGLTQTQVTKNRSGIPLLSELPFIGRLFSQVENREEKRDLLILMTPHIIDEGSAVRPPDGNNK